MPTPHPPHACPPLHVPTATLATTPNSDETDA